MPPTPGSRCAACQHPDVREIDRLIVAGRNYRGITRDFALPDGTVGRHFRSGHVREQDDWEAGDLRDLEAARLHNPETTESGATSLRAESEMRSETAPPLIRPESSPREKLKVVTDWLERRIATGRVRSDELREYRTALKDLREMDDREGPRTVGIRDVEGLGPLIEALFEELEPFPEARLAVLAGLERRGLDRLVG